MVKSSLPRPFLVALVGPTATGKSEVALEMVQLLAEQGIECEIITADSMQVYRYMDIGTAKPGAEARSRVPHHMIDVVEPTEAYNVSRYQRQAAGIVESLLQKGKGVIVVGGTGLYVRALVDGLNQAPAGNLEVRRRLEAEAAAQGSAALYERLVRLDPEAAQKIHPKNVRRMVRALEVYELSGKPFSRFHQEQNVPRWQEQFVWLGLSRPFAHLDQRIAERTERMFQQGLIEEVQRLLSMGCRREHTSMQGLGYKEVAQGLAEGQELGAMVEQVAQRTRRYARRQRTWWRPERRIQWFEVSLGERPRETAERLLRGLVGGR